MSLTVRQPTEETYWNFKTNSQNNGISTMSIISQTDSLVITNVNDDKLYSIDINDPFRVDRTVVTGVEIPNVTVIDTLEFNCIAASRDIVSLIDLEIGEKNYDFYNTPKRQERDINKNTIIDCKFINNQLMATCGKNSQLHLFDIRVNSNDGPISDIGFVNYRFNDGDLNCIGYNGDYISVGNSLGQIYSLDLRNSQIIEDKVSNDSIISLQQSNDSCIFIDEIGDLKIYDITNGNYLLSQNISGGRKSLIGKSSNIEYIKDYNKIITRSNINDNQVQILTIGVNNDINKSGNDLPYYCNEQITKSIEIDDKSIMNINEKSTINFTKYNNYSNRLLASDDKGTIHIWNNAF
ncbi:conserved hypothetical protein [Candida dubliniensis CD36]|uniref:WD repeat-containing protein n=1 Tax=Candida dubliniensis (strain CD36 / ATCC MYA-646 / CBS 7987 / NCPF 3949 / NRRL Y-17841) TaxID=573826 RepID=B9WJJ5_CANDC|nr:conserved hypothetical protein [Candida dubliniensis CD36]CAX40639.1 conserved hypothetical protein [Candida dubliniensis CD36]